MTNDSQKAAESLEASREIIGFLESLKESIDLGVPSNELKYHPEKVIEKIKIIRNTMIEVREEMERMEQDPNELMRGVESALSLIEQNYPDESKFLKVLIEQKLAPAAFHEKVVTLMCDISDAQNGLVGPRAALATIQSYVEVLKLIAEDPSLKAEATRIASSTK